MFVCTLKQFRCCVGRTAAERVQFASRLEFVAKSKVRNLDVHFTVQQEIFCFQISMDDLLLMTILHGRYNLKRIERRKPVSKRGTNSQREMGKERRNCFTFAMELCTGHDV